MNHTLIIPKTLLLKPVHPFPARMATDIAFSQLSKSTKSLKVLDAMSGSGTTAAIASRRGHKAYGFDTDPLAVLISKVWSSNVNKEKTIKIGRQIISRAKKSIKHINALNAFPQNCTDETSRAYIKYWFDTTNRKQLTALSNHIKKIKSSEIRNVLWCAFSRMIIKKDRGVSLAMDVSHSRPHKVYKFSKVKAFDLFEDSLTIILNNLSISDKRIIKPSIRMGDARYLNMDSNFVDLVISSPPYLNAIDYMRGHRLSLIWMGHSIDSLRNIRRTNIGSESRKINASDYENILSIICKSKHIQNKYRGILLTYLIDLNKMLKEAYRVLKKHGTAVFVIGNSTIYGKSINNSAAIEYIALQLGFKLINKHTRRLPSNKRYLPPPSKSTGSISLRMRTEIVLTFTK